MKDLPDYQIILNTSKFAKEAHKNQVRKYTNTPYIDHPIQVSKILLKLHPKASTQMIQAALLHDTVEDTLVTIEDIVEHFGFSVAKLVEGLTDVSTPSMGNRRFRKALDLKHISESSVATQIIKCADLIHNSESIIKYDKNFAVVYIKEKSLLLCCMKEETKQTVIWKHAKEICDEYYRNN